MQLPTAALCAVKVGDRLDPTQKEGLDQIDLRVQKFSSPPPPPHPFATYITRPWTRNQMTFFFKYLAQLMGKKEINYFHNMVINIRY